MSNFIMNIFLAITPLIVLTTSFPSPDVQGIDAAQLSPAKAHCKLGRVYCFGQVTKDFGMIPLLLPLVAWRHLIDSVALDVARHYSLHCHFPPFRTED